MEKIWLNGQKVKTIIGKEKERKNKMVLLLKLELENITTHENTTIEFKKGINVLSGENGTGKSTVMKMIGYLLFFSLPGNQKDYVRNIGAINHGTATLWFVGMDGQEYSIKKWIGSSSRTPVVRNETLGVRMHNLERKSDIQRWIKEQLGLAPATKLEDLFENSVGIQQGSFVYPFLNSPSQRQAFFGPMLDVKVYKDIYKNYLEIEKEFSAEKSNLSNNIASLEGEIKEKDDLLAEKENLASRIKEHEVARAIIVKELKQIEEEIGKLENLKNERDVVKGELDRLQVQLEGNRKQADITRKNLERAMNAKEIIESAKPGHDRFNAASIEHDELRKKIGEMEKKERELRNIETQLNGLETNINIKRENLTKLEKLLARLTVLEPKFKEYEEKTKVLNELQVELNRIETIESEMKEEASKLAKLVLDKRQLEVKLENRRTFEEKKKLLGDPEQESRNIEKEIAALEARIRQLEQNKEKTRGGNCPFLGEPCKNLGGESLESYFEDSIKDVQEKLAPLTEKKREIEKRLALLEEIEKEFEALISVEAHVEMLEKQVEELKLGIEAKKDQIKRKGEIQEKIEATKDKLDNLKKEHDEYVSLRARKDEIEPLSIEIKSLEQKVEELREKMAPLKEATEPLDEARERLKELQEILDSNRQDHQAYLQHFNEARMEEEYKNRLQEIEQAIQTLTARISLKTKIFEELSKKFDEKKLLELMEKRDTLITRNATLSTQIEANKDRVATIDKRLLEITQKEKEISRLRKELDELGRIMTFSSFIREWFNKAGPLVTDALLGAINTQATIFYRSLKKDQSAIIKWKNDYDVELRTPNNVKVFSQLSGGEQMDVALSIRLAILRVLTKMDFVLLDEPTVNLDRETRFNLAGSIRDIPGFKQIFVISHDDSFWAYADHVIQFTKDAQEVTSIQYMMVP